MKTKTLFFVSFSMLFALFLGQPSVLHAQTDDTSPTSDVVAEETLEEVSKVPTRLGTFLRNFREQVSLLFTFDVLKKAEKQIVFAEARIDLAEQILEGSESERAREFAQRMIERSSELIKKAEKRKEKWLERSEEKKEKLLDKITKGEEKRGDVLDKLEEKIPEEKLNNFHEFRERVTKESRRVLRAIENEKMPEKAKARLMQVKERVEEDAEEVQKFLAEQKELLERMRAGDEDALEELKQLLEERREFIKDRMKERGERLKSQREDGESEEEHEEGDDN